MERSDLVMSLVFANESAFTDLTTSESNICLLINKTANQTANIKECHRMNKAEYVKQLFNSFDKNITSLVFARYKNDTDKTQACEERMYSILDKVSADKDMEDWFFRLLCAEFKDKVYWMFYDPYIEAIEADITHAYSDLFYSSKYDYLLDILYEHAHDPTHHLFKGKSYHYYEMGKDDQYNDYNILHQWETEVLNTAFIADDAE